MAKIHRPRHGTLQFWPKKRAEKMLPGVNWTPIIKRNPQAKLLGFIAYKVGMKTALVKDNTPNSMTKDKKIVMPVTIIEVPGMKVFSIRLHKNNKIVTEILAQHLDKELQRKIKLPKTHKTSKMEEVEKDLSKYDRVTILAYSLVKKTGIKRTPDMSEIALGFNGNVSEQFNYAKTLMEKEIRMSEYFKEEKMVDLRGVTTGRGLTGPIKRYGLELKQHKSEKGRRRPGSLAPWHPARTTYMSPNAGQHGLFTRPIYNNQVVTSGDATKNPEINPNGGWVNYGVVRNEYMVLRGSVQGPSKRAIIITTPLRRTKEQQKKKYDFIDLR